MKFFYKLFLSIVLLLTAALAAVEYFSVAFSTGHAFSRELSSELTQHQLIKYTIQTALLSAEENGTVSDNELSLIGESTAAGLSEGDTLMLSDTAGNEYYSGVSVRPAFDGDDTASVRYRVVNSDNAQSLLFTESHFTQSGRSLVLLTERNITAIFTEAEMLYRQYAQLYIIILLTGAAAALVLSWLMTRHLATLRSVSRRFAAGSYHTRAHIHSRDEIGELSDAYNQMADTIEEKIYELEEAARRQEDFTASFAHELKTPMTSIIGYADTLYQKNMSAAEARQCAWYILNEGMRLEALSFKLLELQTLKRTAFTLEEADISAILQDAADTVLPSAVKRNVELSCNFDTGWVRIEYDLFKTLLLNLLDNAFKSGCTHVWLLGAAENGAYRISITDNGRGIPADELKHITEAFYMVDKSRSRKEHGAGLGLALASRIADIHGTELKYESQPGKGTCVSFVLKLEADIDEE